MNGASLLGEALDSLKLGVEALGDNPTYLFTIHVFLLYSWQKAQAWTPDVGAKQWIDALAGVTRLGRSA